MNAKRLILTWSAAVIAAASSAMTAPTGLTLSGEALDEAADIACTLLPGDTFEAFARLKGGKTLKIAAEDGSAAYTAAGGTLAEGDGGLTVASDGIYDIVLDFAGGKASVRKVSSVGLFYCWDNRIVSELQYAGAGTWKSAWHCSLASVDWGIENRYHFRMTYDGGQTACWGPARHGEDSTPGDDPAYFNTVRYDEYSQWDPHWKFLTSLNDTDIELCLSLNGTQTHSIAEPGASVPTAMTASGEALAEGGEIAFTRIEPGVFELFAEMKAGRGISFGDYSIGADGTIVRTPSASTVDRDGVYCVSFNFLTGKASISEVGSVNLYYCMSGSNVAALEYAGAGTWKGFWTCAFSEESWGTETRYRFAATIGGRQVVLGAVNPDKVPTAASDYNLRRYIVDDKDQFSGNWKFPAALNGKSIEVTVRLRGDAFSHSVAEASKAVETPESMTATGDALAEGGPLAFTRIDANTFELFTRLEGGRPLYFGGYEIGPDGKIAEGNGAYTVATPGIYCINFDFLAGKASVKEVTHMGLYLCWDGASVADMAYIGKGEWTASYTWNHNDDRYKFIMTLGGETVFWGPADLSLDSRPDGTPEYYHMQRTYPVDQWANKWKFDGSYAAQPLIVTARLNGDRYTHSVAIDTTTSAIDTAADKSAGLVSVSGHTVAATDDAVIYSLSGIVVTRLGAGRSVELGSGMYVAVSGTRIQKIVIM